MSPKVDSPDRKSVRDDPLVLTAYCINRYLDMPLVPASLNRDWMEATDKRYANRCLPLLIANQAGWMLLSAHELVIAWTGGNSTASVYVEVVKGNPPWPASSHFGYGIVTWHVPYLFRTPPGYNLLARGPANLPKDGIFPLEGIIETDWSYATFTMNWKMTRANQSVTFQVGDPICMLVPQRRGELEAFRPEIRNLETAPGLHQDFEAWSQGRDLFNTELHRPGSEAAKQGWQKHYFRGIAPGAQPMSEHQTKLRLRPFTDCEPESVSLPPGQSIRTNLLYWPNSTLHRIGDHWQYVERKIEGESLSRHLVKLEGDALLNAVLERAQSGAGMPELVQALLLRPEASEIAEEEAGTYLQELIDSAVLVSATSPIVTEEPYATTDKAVAPVEERRPASQIQASDLLDTADPSASELPADLRRGDQ